MAAETVPVLQIDGTQLCKQCQMFACVVGLRAVRPMYISPYIHIRHSLMAHLNTMSYIIYTFASKISCTRGSCLLPNDCAYGLPGHLRSCESKMRKRLLLPRRVFLAGATVAHPHPARRTPTSFDAACPRKVENKTICRNHTAVWYP